MAYSKVPNNRTAVRLLGTLEKVHFNDKRVDEITWVVLDKPCFPDVHYVSPIYNMVYLGCTPGLALRQHR